MVFTPKLGKPAGQAVMERVQAKQAPPPDSTSQGAGAPAQGPDFLTGLGIGAAKGVGSTLFNIGKLEHRAVNKVGELLGRAPTPLHEESDMLKPQGAAENIGFGAEQVGEFFIPGGAVVKGAKAADVAIQGSKLLGGGSKIAGIARGLAKTGTRSILEGGSAAGVRAAQTGGEPGDTAGVGIAGALLPPAARVIQGFAKSAPYLGSILSGVPRETIQRAADPVAGKRIADAVKAVGENKAQPYFALTNATVSSVQKASKAAGEFVKKAVGKFSAANKDKTFDVASKYDDVTKALEPFRTSGLIVPRAGRGFKIAATPQSPFTQREVGELNKLLEKLRVSKSIGAEDVLALKRSFATAYDAVPLGVNGNPRPYHAAVMALKENADKAIQGLLPKELQQAFGQYTKFETFMSKFGGKLVDSEGNVKPNAEQFISNLGNLNKGELRAVAGEHSGFLGRDLADEVQVIKDAQKLSPLFAATGSRTQDVLRSLITAGIGFGASGGNPLGSAALLGATSPKAVGLAARGVGKVKEAIGEVPLLGAIRNRLLGTSPGESPITRALRDRYRKALEAAKK